MIRKDIYIRNDTNSDADLDRKPKLQSMYIIKSIKIKSFLIK